IQYLADLEGRRVVEILRRLKDAGLGAIPGGGAEIFAQEIRERICSAAASVKVNTSMFRTSDLSEMILIL
ncbi:hypothetical protein LCGC14_2713970, partial [marine sediment metagenome]